MMLGEHSALDLQNLVGAADRELAGLGRGYTALHGGHDMPASWRQGWEADYGALRRSYADARRPAIAKIIQSKDLPGVRLDVVTAEREYAGVKKSLEGFRPLRARLATAGIGTSEFGGDPASFPASARVTTHDTGTAGRLNVHTEAVQSSSSAGAFEHNAAITILGPSNGGFYPVRGPGVIGHEINGWASASFITADAQTVTPDTPIAPNAVPAAPTGSLARVSTAQTGVAGRLNVRKTPATGGDIIGTFEHLQVVTITGPAVAGFFPVAGKASSGAQIAGFGSVQFLAPADAPIAPAPAPQAAPQAPQAAPIPQAPQAPQAAPQAAPIPQAPQAAPLAIPPSGGIAPATPADDDDGMGKLRLLAFAGLLGAAGLGYVIVKKPFGEKKILTPKTA